MDAPTFVRAEIPRLTLIPNETAWGRAVGVSVTPDPTGGPPRHRYTFELEWAPGQPPAMLSRILDAARAGEPLPIESAFPNLPSGRYTVRGLNVRKEADEMHKASVELEWVSDLADSRQRHHG